MSRRGPVVVRWALAIWTAAVSAAPARAEDWKLGPGAEVARGNFSFRLAGYAQEDFRSFRDWEAGDEDTGLLRSRTSELRRIRIGFELEWKRLSLEFDVDPRNGDDQLKDAYAELKLHDALRVRGGHFKLPVNVEFLTSASRTDFVERALLATHIGPARDVGVMLFGDLARWLTYQVGVFRGDGRTRADRSETTGVARLVVSPWKGVELGGCYAEGRVDADPDGPGSDPRPKGILGEGPAGFEFYERHFVSGRRRRMGLEAVVRRGPFGLLAQALQGREERKGQGSTFDDLPEQVATGWSVGATWLLTGERKDRRIRPRRPVPSGIGAWELGLRYEGLAFDDDGPATLLPLAGNRARDIRRAGDRIVTGGLSWWPVAWVRLMGNVIVERYHDALLAPEPGRQGDYVTVLGRLQVQIP